MIVIRDLNVSIGSTILIEKVGVSIDTGKFIAIVGPNGAGKSTFLSAVTLEIPSDYKTYSFKGRDIKSFTRDELPRCRAKFSQHHATEIHLPIEDIVMMGRYPYFNQEPNQEDREIVQKCMKKTETSHLVNRTYEQLSGGEKQRLHLARVLSQLENEEENKLLLLDEPLNNLDVAHQFKTLELVKKFTAKGHTALVVIHDLNLAARFADEVLLMQNGKLQAKGTPEEVFTVERLESVYNYPCVLMQHPQKNYPIILFG